MTRLIAAVALVAAVALTGCNRPDPCATLPQPTPAQLDAARDGDYDKDVGGVECELVLDSQGGGHWEREPEG